MAAINRFLQARSEKEGLEEVAAVEAAGWLDAEGLLADSFVRRGQPLRKLLRKGLIVEARQRANGRWWIHREES